MIGLDIKVKINKRVALDFPDAQAVIEEIGRYAAAALRRRVRDEGVAADGRALPEVQEGRRKESQAFFVSADDPRYKKLAGRGGLKKVGGQLRAAAGGYRAFKQRLGLGTHRGSSLTGKMWAALTITGKGRLSGNAWLDVRLYFAGGITTASGYVRNRTKAQLLQYATRTGATGAKPTGQPDFILMQLSARESAEIAKLAAKHMRILKAA